MPKCLYVKFYDIVDGKKVAPAWSIGSMDNGVYCVGAYARVLASRCKGKSSTHEDQAEPDACGT